MQDSGCLLREERQGTTYLSVHLHAITCKKVQFRKKLDIVIEVKRLRKEMSLDIVIARRKVWVVCSWKLFMY